MVFSLWGAKPIVYFDFIRGDVHWRYTNADREQTYGGYTWAPARGIKRSNIKDSAERRQLTITVTVPTDLPVLANWRPYPPRDRIALIILVRDAAEPTAQSEWVGRVLGPKFGGPSVTLACEPSLTRARRAGMNLCWQRGCPLAQYSIGRGMCNLIKSEWAVPVATMTQVDAITFTAPEFAAQDAIRAGRLAGGFIEYVRVGDGVVEPRSIMTHVGDTITTDYGLYDAPAGLACTVYPHCRQDAGICNDEFANLANNGGEAHMPGKSPYNGQRRS